MKNKILTLEDLYNYYAATSKRSRHFSSKDEDANIVVQVPGNILFEKDNDSTEGLTPVILQSCHIGKNVNMSKIDKDVMEKALPSFSNRPILGYIHQVDGEWQFYDHRMHMEDDEVVYDERPIGIIPESCNAHLEYDEEKDKTYTVVSGYLFDEYSHATEIMERDGECACSVELSIRELSFDAKSKVLNIEDFYFSGVTALGKTPDGEDVKPGMAGANMKLSDFTQQTVFSQDNVIAMLSEIREKINQLSINNLGKEENPMEFEDNVEVTETVEADTEVVMETAEAEAEDVEEAATEESTEEVTVTEAQSEETNEVTPSEEEKFSKTFEISHEDIRVALYALIAPYEEADNDWYGITAVYDDSFIYEGWFNSDNKYRQSYSKDGDNIKLEGERVHMNVEYLTDSELVALNDMRSNYSKINEELDKYHAEPEKMQILESADYSQIAESDEFVALKAQDAHFDMSVDEVRASADAILLNAAKNGKIEFAKSDAEPKPVTMKKLPIGNSKKAGRYGGLFSK